MALNGRLKTGIARGWRMLQSLRPAAPRLTILYYHSVPASDAAMFDRQMGWLARNANLVTPDHDGPLDPRRPNVAVTFDDAFASVAEFGLPALQRHGIPATIFVPSGWLGRNPGWQMETNADRQERVMDADALRALPQGQIRFGSHTVDHPRMTQLSAKQREAQFTRSRETLEQVLSTPIDTLAFPYGDCDGEVIEQARALGYRHVYSVLPEAVRPQAGGICRGRTAVDAGDPLSLFQLKALGAFEWMPAAIRAKRMLRRLIAR